MNHGLEYEKQYGTLIRSNLNKSVENLRSSIENGVSKIEQKVKKISLIDIGRMASAPDLKLYKLENEKDEKCQTTDGDDLSIGQSDTGYSDSGHSDDGQSDNTQSDNGQSDNGQSNSKSSNPKKPKRKQGVVPMPLYINLNNVNL